MDRIQANSVVHEVFNAWAPSLARHARRLTTDRAAADDLVQEAFLALYKELRAGKAIENPRAWTLAVVRHYAARHARDHARRGEQLQPTGSFDELAGPCLAPPDAASEEVSRLLSVLTEREEEVVLLRLDCLRYREIAGQLGINEKTVATLLARGLRKLRQAFAATLAPTALPKQESDVSKALQ
jgi:RNA polymerase sigma-70 factor (ECF subfamily)